MVWLIKFNHECMHNHLSPNIYLSIKVYRGKMHFNEKLFVKKKNVCTVLLDSYTIVTPVVQCHIRGQNIQQQNNQNFD